MSNQQQQHTPATVDEIARFKAAAARRYQEQNVRPDIADYAFNRYMAKQAEALGFQGPEPSGRVKAAAALIQSKLSRK